VVVGGGGSVTVSRCPSKLDHRASGTVLWCAHVRGHGGLHLSGDQLWADDDEHVIQGGDACCAGEWGYASPVDFHTDDCPEYLANMAAFEAQRPERKSPERRTIESSILTASLRRAIAHLRDVEAGTVQADAHTERLVELGLELGDAVNRIRAARTT
jgi:hypothetical protein